PRLPVGLDEEQGTDHCSTVCSLHRQTRSRALPPGDLHSRVHGHRRVLRRHHRPARCAALRGHPLLGRHRRGTARRCGDLQAAVAPHPRHGRRSRRPLCAHPRRRPVPGVDAGLVPRARTYGLWIIVLLVYCGIASVLPVWVLLQPRDYINGVQLFIALILLYGAVIASAFFSSGHELVAPAINTDLPAGTPSILPLLFVTIACG